MLCDNQAVIRIAKNPVHHDRTKHVETDRHLIKEAIEGKLINIFYIPTSQKVADIITKALSKAKFEDMRSKIGLLNIYSPARERVLKTKSLQLYSYYRGFYFLI